MTAFEILRRLLGTPQEGGALSVVVSTSVTPLSSTAQKVKMVTIKADKSNTDAVYIGFDPAMTVNTGLPLDPGESIDIVIDDLSKLYALSQSTAQKIYVLWVK